MGVISVIAAVVLFFVLRAKAQETASAESYAEIFSQPKMPSDISESGNDASDNESAPSDIIIEESEASEAEDETEDKDE